MFLTHSKRMTRKDSEDLSKFEFQYFNDLISQNFVKVFI